MNKIKSNPYKTLLTISLGFLFISLFFRYDWATLTGFVIGLLGLINFRIARLMEKIWFKIAEILGLFVPNILLSTVFYLFLFPIAVLSKIFISKNKLNLNKTNSTNYALRNKKYTYTDLKNPW